MDLYFLEARIPLVKSFTKQGGQYKVEPYPLAKNVSSIKEHAASLTDFKDLIATHGEQGHCLMKGTLNRDLYVESRAGATDPYVRTSWMCLDLDYFDDESRLSRLLGELGLSDVSYIKQYSSSHGITKKFGAHLFFMLSEPVLPNQLKLWLMERNLNISMLADHISLTRTAAALRWPLDISVADNSKLLYISPPNCTGFEDPIDERVTIETRTHNEIDISGLVSDIDATRVQQLKQDKLTELRKKMGLKARTFKTRTVAGTEVLQNPGETEVTGMKSERGFMYLNINGGDSWGYYHPIDSPEIIYNFKGEPNYLAKELIPGYYRAFKKEELKETHRGTGDIKYFAFLDRKSDTYYRGTYDPEAYDLDIYPTGNVKKVEDFLKQHGQFVGDYIEEWDYLFRFDDDRIFVPEEKFVNQYRPSPVLRNAKPPTTNEFPPTISKVIESVCGNDKEVVTHLLNWMAVIVQQRQRTQTMWVFHGVPGTGKGVLVHKILAPLLGQEYVSVKSLSELEDKYNHYMERCVILMIDESKRTQIRDMESVMAKLKQACTDPVISIRAMNTGHYIAKNYMNIIVASNYPDPITIESGDRRINVGFYQDKKLDLDTSDIKRIERELPTFAWILQNANADVEKAKTPLQNEAREKLMFLSRTSLEIMFSALRNGNLQFFIDNLPTDAGMATDTMHAVDQEHFTGILREAEDHALKNKVHVITRDQVKALANYTIGDMPRTANKFSSLVKHYGITFERHRKDNKLVQSMTVQWQKPEVFVDDVMETTRLRSVK